MTIIEKSSWTGLPITDVRPHNPRIRMLQQLKTVAQDQAYLHKTLTGNAVPNAPGSDVATNHTHDGTTGAVVPIPYCQAFMGASMARGPTSGGAWQPLCRQIFRNLAGVTTVRVLVWTTNIFALLSGGFRGSILAATSGLPASFDSGTWLDMTQEYGGGGLFCLGQDMTVTADALQILKLEAFNSYYAPGTNAIMPPERDVAAFAILPWLGEPTPSFAWQDSTVTTGQIDLPDTTQHLGSYPFTSFDDAMFADGRAVSSYLVQSLVLNEGLLWERATGRPAALNADGHTNAAHYDGHSHGGATTSGTTDNVGAEMDHHIGAWHYGVGCESGLESPGGITVDQPSASDNQFTGRLYAPALARLVSGSDEVIAEHIVRLPRGQSGTYVDATGNLNFAAVVYHDFSKAGTLTITVTMLDENGGTAGTSRTGTITSGGPAWQVVQVSGIDASGSSTGGEVQTVRVAIKQASVPSSLTVAYGSACMWLER